ncbi:MAG: hypothetical protein AAF639_44580 [Chloroflexota bacterium]
MNIRAIILEQLAEVVTEFSPLSFPDDVTDETALADFWLDSIAFVSLISNLEDVLGYIPKAVTEGEFDPKTVGDFVALYTESVVS